MGVKDKGSLVSSCFKHSKFERQESQELFRPDVFSAAGFAVARINAGGENQLLILNEALNGHISAVSGSGLRGIYSTGTGKLCNSVITGNKNYTE